MISLNQLEKYSGKADQIVREIHGVGKLMRTAHTTGSSQRASSHTLSHLSSPAQPLILAVCNSLDFLIAAALLCVCESQGLGVHVSVLSCSGCLSEILL